jgi:hypothetical protein
VIERIEPACDVVQAPQDFLALLFRLLAAADEAFGGGCEQGDEPDAHQHHRESAIVSRGWPVSEYSITTVGTTNKAAISSGHSKRRSTRSARSSTRSGFDERARAPTSENRVGGLR